MLRKVPFFPLRSLCLCVKDSLGHPKDLTVAAIHQIKIAVHRLLDVCTRPIFMHRLVKTGQVLDLDLDDDGPEMCDLVDEYAFFEARGCHQFVGLLKLLDHMLCLTRLTFEDIAYHKH